MYIYRQKFQREYNSVFASLAMLARFNKEVRETDKNSLSIFLSVMGAYIVRTSSLNDKLLSN